MSYTHAGASKNFQPPFEDSYFSRCLSIKKPTLKTFPSRLEYAY